jgi:hypothetical protein
LKEEALDRTIWRACFGRGFGPVVRQTTKWMNESATHLHAFSKLGYTKVTYCINIEISPFTLKVRYKCIKPCKCKLRKIWRIFARVIQKDSEAHLRLQLSSIIQQFKLTCWSEQPHTSHWEINTIIVLFYLLIKPTVKFHCYFMCVHANKIKKDPTSTVCIFFDTDMSYASRVRTASHSSNTSYSVSRKVLHQRTASHSSHSVSHKWRHAAAAMRAHNVLCNNYNRITVEMDRCSFRRVRIALLYIVTRSKKIYNRHAQHCTEWHIYVLCVRHIHDPILLP